MAQRGRKSAASLVVVSSKNFPDRPAPPAGLTPEQSQEWMAIVNRMPPDWFPCETHGLLAQYVRHVARAKKLGSILDKHDSNMKLSAKDYALLLRQETAQSKIIAALATKMRIAQQSTYDKSKKKPVDDRPLPCDFEDDDEEDDNEEEVAG